MLVTYNPVEGEGLRTTYAFAPRVMVSVKRDGPTSLRLEFASSPVYQDGQEFRVTNLAFEKVLEYSWDQFEFHRLASNRDDVEFALINIVDSGIIAELEATGRSLPENIHHYRICFDDHGTYDVVGESLVISYGGAVDDEKYP